MYICTSCCPLGFALRIVPTTVLRCRTIYIYRLLYISFAVQNTYKQKGSEADRRLMWHPCPYNLYNNNAAHTILLERSLVQLYIIGLYSFHSV